MRGGFEGEMRCGWMDVRYVFNSYVIPVHSLTEFFCTIAEKPPRRIQTVTSGNISWCLNPGLWQYLSRHSWPSPPIFRSIAIFCSLCLPPFLVPLSVFFARKFCLPESLFLDKNLNQIDLLSSSLGNAKNYRQQQYFRPLKFFIVSFLQQNHPIILAPIES